jgi:hypothetical protein
MEMASGPSCQLLDPCTYPLPQFYFLHCARFRGPGFESASLHKKKGKGCLEIPFPRPQNVWELSALCTPLLPGSTSTSSNQCLMHNSAPPFTLPDSWWHALPNVALQWKGWKAKYYSRAMLAGGAQSPSWQAAENRLE